MNKQMDNSMFVFGEPIDCSVFPKRKELVVTKPPEAQKDANGNCLHINKSWFNLYVKMPDIFYCRYCSDCNKVLTDDGTALATYDEIAKELEDTTYTEEEKKQLLLNFEEINGRGSIKWHDDIKREAQIIFDTHQEQGWDGYDAEPIKPEALTNMFKIIDQLPANVVAPEVVPEVNGALSLEWQGKGRLLTIEANENTLWCGNSFTVREHPEVMPKEFATNLITHFSTEASV